MYYERMVINCSVVQLVERRTVNARVAGSSPAGAVVGKVKRRWLHKSNRRLFTCVMLKTDL
jgi:hypothetical protein